ncbi:outer membrane beta-barrel protein [Paludibaculum fermentans]|uniref:outer membrane beta-barrel protein n=1 Tax=Paludibaculum fermentans TaxID=1473598 RepID=UPI003EC072A4
MVRLTQTAVVCLLFCLTAMAQEFSKYTFEGGGGFSAPSGAASDRFNTGWNLLFGGGYRFTKNISGMLEYQVDRFSLTNTLLQNNNQPDGFNTYWAFTLNPRYDFHPKGHINPYVTAGYGIYHRRLAFTDPSRATGYCDQFSGYCYNSGAPVVADFTNFKAGYNVGGGLNYALGDSGMKVFTDVRFNRFIAHNTNDWVSVTFGLRF